MVSLIEELISRDALVLALSGRTATTLDPLLSFLDRNITKPAFSRVLVVVALQVADLYSSILGKSRTIDMRFKSILRRVQKEVELQQKLQVTLGTLEAIFASTGAMAPNNFA